MNYPFNDIRKAYEKHNPSIMEALQEDPRKWIRPYFLNWMSFMSPIEKQTWEALRYYGHLPMFPQYPVRNHFVDFGNPVLKIAIECDGKQFHQDKGADHARSFNIAAEGWKIYRISGSDCYKLPSDEHYNFDPDERMDDYRKRMEFFYLFTVEGLIHSLKARYIPSGYEPTIGEGEDGSAERYEAYWICVDLK